MDKEKRTVCPENLQRFNNIIVALQSIAKQYGDVSLAATTEEDPWRDGIAYLFLPTAVKIPKTTMHLLHTACFAADECEMTASGKHRISFIVRNIYADGPEIPAAPKE